MGLAHVYTNVHMRLLFFHSLPNVVQRLVKLGIAIIMLLAYMVVISPDITRPHTFLLFFLLVGLCVWLGLGVIIYKLEKFRRYVLSTVVTVAIIYTLALASLGSLTLLQLALTVFICASISIVVDRTISS